MNSQVVARPVQRRNVVDRIVVVEVVAVNVVAARVVVVRASRKGISFGCRGSFPLRSLRRSIGERSAAVRNQVVDVIADLRVARHGVPRNAAARNDYPWRPCNISSDSTWTVIRSFVSLLSALAARASAGSAAERYRQLRRDAVFDRELVELVGKRLVASHVLDLAANRDLNHRCGVGIQLSASLRNT